MFCSNFTTVRGFLLYIVVKSLYLNTLDISFACSEMLNTINNNASTSCLSNVQELLL